MNPTTHDTTSETNRLRERVDELESRLAFQDDTIQALDQTIADQSQALLTLQEQCSLLIKKLRQLEEGSQPQGVAGADERPPHY